MKSAEYDKLTHSSIEIPWAHTSEHQRDRLVALRKLLLLYSADYNLTKAARTAAGVVCRSIERDIVRDWRIVERE